MTVILGSLFIAYREYISFLFLKLIENEIPALIPNLFFTNQIKHKNRKAKFVPFSSIKLCQVWIGPTVYLQHRFIGHAVMVF